MMDAVIHCVMYLLPSAVSEQLLSRESGVFVIFRYKMSDVILKGVFLAKTLLMYQFLNLRL